MKTYDVIVVGSGSGGEIIDAAVSHGLTVAWVDKGPLGGTCLNVGCIPSKIIIHPADRIMEILEAKKLGITAEIKDIDFQAIMQRVQRPIQESHAGDGARHFPSKEPRLLQRRRVFHQRLHVAGIWKGYPGREKFSLVLVHDRSSL